MTPQAGSAQAGQTRPAWVRLVIIVLIVLVCGWLASTFLGSIDWSEVRRALGRLAFWQVLPLIALLLLRQTLNALPLALFIPGLGVRRALKNDLTSSMMSIIAPPPGDIVVRVAMFKSWGIDASRGIAGATMNMLVFYVNRFAVPILGVLILWALGDGTDKLALALLSTLIGIALAVVIGLVVRGDGLAGTLGTLGGRIVRRFRSKTDPESWAASATRFQGHIGEKYQRGFRGSLLGLVLMVLVDAGILLLALRFVGVSSSDLSMYIVFGVFLVGYPLTIPPLMGLGIFDLVLLGAYMDASGDAFEPAIIAALTIWRATTILVPIILGIGTTAHWRWTDRRAKGQSEQVTVSS